MWPMSRKSNPKQFQPLVGEKTLFRQSVDRLLTGFDIKDIFISAGEANVKNIRKELPELPDENLLIEPAQRDTLGCVGFAVSCLHAKFGDCVVATMWADHYVRNVKEYIQSFKAAEKIASRENLLVNIDANPTSPNVNLGYMEMGKLIKEIDGFPVYELIRQVEKPNLEKAKEFVRSFHYLWHTGYTIFKTSLMIDLYKTHTPEVYELIQKTIAAKGDSEKKEIFAKVPKISIDFAIYEKVAKGKFVEIPADLGWTDVGAWNILKDELAENGKALVIKGKNVDLGSIDCLFYELNPGKIMATVGCENLIVVDTPDTLLVASKFKSQEVKKIVERLKNEDGDKYL